MGQIKLLYDTTVQMLVTLQKLEEDDHDRDSIIHEMDELIVKREEIISTIHEPYTDEEIKVGQKVVQFNEHIKVKMEHLYEDVKSDMKKVKQKKELNRSYINPYGKIKTTDGMYVDSKN